ncbi:MAG: cbb3-type cytochrome c oxidase subunit II, partial [Chthoniobacterales bacterium]
RTHREHANIFEPAGRRGREGAHMKGVAPLFLGIFGTFLFSWTGLTLIPNFQIGHLDPQSDEEQTDIYPVPKSGMAERGRKIYAANGCVYCHSQQVRADYAASDIDRKWGTRRSAPRDYIFERPALLGKMRVGPDLSNIGKRAPSEDQNAPPPSSTNPAPGAAPPPNAPQPNAATSPVAAPNTAPPAAATSPAANAPQPKAAASPSAAAAAPAAATSPAGNAPQPKISASPGASPTTATAATSPAPNAPQPKPGDSPSASAAPAAASAAGASPSASAIAANSPAPAPTNATNPSVPPPSANAAATAATSADNPNTPSGVPPVYSAAWHHLHLYNPRSVLAGSTSNMPSFRFLYEKRRVGGEHAADALKLTGNDAPEEGWEIVPSYDAKCLVAYLMSLDQSHELKEAKLSTAPPSSSPAPAKEEKK